MYFVICQIVFVQIVFVQIVKAAILQSARASRLQFNNGPEILGPTSGFATSEIISLMAKLAMLCFLSYNEPGNQGGKLIGSEASSSGI